MNNNGIDEHPPVFSPSAISGRFRLRQPSLTTQAPHVITKKRAASDGKASNPACQRCRRLKKKCSRTFPECVLCVGAGVTCSIAETSEKSDTEALQERIEWLSRIINERLLPASPVEAVETGAVIPQMISGGSHVEYSMSVHQNRKDGSMSGAVSDHSGVAAVLASMSTGRIDENWQLNNKLSLDPAWTQEPKSLSVLPPAADCRRFVDAYFRHVHRAYPFADQRVTLAALENTQIWEQSNSDPASTKLYLIMAIGYTTLQRAGQLLDDTSGMFKFSYAQVVQQCLENPSIESVEILLLLSLYSLSDPSGLSPWTLVGILSRQAISIGITRASEQSSPSQVEQRHRLYWSIFVLDRMVSVYLGLPIGFNDENAETQLPGIMVEEFAAPERLQNTFSLQISRHVIQLRQLEENILKRVHLKGRLSSSYLSLADKRVIIQGLRSQIENWYSHGCLLSPAENDNIPFHSTISWLTVRYYNLLILLHGPCHFNSELTRDQISGLHQCIQKYVQSSAILLQQRQLPLNWITLYRFLPICSIMLYCIVRNKQSLFATHMEAVTCAEILESFPPSWTIATRSTSIFRAIAELACKDTSIVDMCTSPASTRHSVYQGSDTSEYSVRNSAQLQELIADSNKLVSEVLGKSSAFYIESFSEHNLLLENSQSANYSWDHVPQNNGGDTASWQGIGMDFL
jgi:hypothetical protein